MAKLIHGTITVLSLEQVWKEVKAGRYTHIDYDHANDWYTLRLQHDGSRWQIPSTEWMFHVGPPPITTAKPKDPSRLPPGGNPVPAPTPVPDSDRCQFCLKPASECICLVEKTPEPPDPGGPIEREYSNRSPLEIIHVLHKGAPLCGFSRDRPVDWPEGHTWVPLAADMRGVDIPHRKICKQCAPIALKLFQELFGPL